MSILIGTNGISKIVTSVFCGDSNNQAVRITGGFVGDGNNQARSILSSEVIIEYHAEFEIWLKSWMSYTPASYFQYRYINNYIKILNPSSISSAVSIPVNMQASCSLSVSPQWSASVFNISDSLTKTNPTLTYTNNWWENGEAANPSYYSTGCNFRINNVNYNIASLSGSNIYSNWTRVATVNKTEQIVISNS